MKRLVSILLAAVLLLSVLSASGCGAAATEARNLKIGVLSDAKNLNPFMGYGTTETFITGMVYDTLLGWDDAKGICTPNLAESFELKDGGTTISLVLNKKATFSDGKPLTADDVVFTFQMIQGNTFPGFMSITGNLAEAVKTGDYSVDLKLRAPLAGSLRLLGTAVSIVPKHIWSTIKDPVNEPNLTPIGSGPFKLAKKVDGQYMILEARKHFLQKYNLKQITLTVCTDQTVGLMSLKSGQFDLLDWGVDPAVAADITKNPANYPGVKVANAPTSSVTTLMFNLRRDPWSDVNLRKAVSMVIDQEKLIADVLLGYGKPQGPGLVAPTMPYFNDKYPAVKADPAGAAALLDQSGYKDTNKDGFRETPAGKKFALELLTYNVPPQLTVGQYLEAELKAIGIKTTLSPQTPEAIRTRWQAADFDASLSSLSFANQDMMFFYYTTSRGVITNGRVAGFNYGGYTNPAYDGISMAMRSENDVAKRTDLLKQMQVFIADAYYQVPIYTADVIRVYRDDRLTGWTSLPEESVANTASFQALTPKK